MTNLSTAAQVGAGLRSKIGSDPILFALGLGQLRPREKIESELISSIIAKNAKENDSFTAKVAKDAKEEKSLTAEDAKETKEQHGDERG